MRLRTEPDTTYVWVGGSCDYAHEERCSGGAYLMQQGDEIIDRYTTSDDHTTEFRMILGAMIHAMEQTTQPASIVFLTNVSYILQNWDKTPTEKSANSDLIVQCIRLKALHTSVTVKLVPFHKYTRLIETHQMAHNAMLTHRMN